MNTTELTSVHTLPLPIKGKYTFTVDELLMATALARKESARASFRRWYRPAGVLLLAGGLFLFNSKDPGPALLLIASGAFYAGFLNPLTKFFIRRHFAKRPDRDIELSYEGSDEGLTWITPHSRSTVGWLLIAKARKHKNGILLFANDAIFHWLPNHSLEREADLQVLSELIRRHVTDYKEVK